MTHRYDGDSQQTQDRAAYEAPRVTFLGSLSELTLGPLGSNEDGIDGNLDIGSL